MHTSRSGALAESSAVDSTESRNVCSSHWMSSKTATSGACPRAACGTPRRSRLRSSPPRSHPEAADRRRCNRVGREYRELLHDLHHGPVRDPLSIEQAAAPDDASLDRVQRLGNQPRLAHAGVAYRQSPAHSGLIQRPIPRLGERSQSRSRPTNRDASQRLGASRTRRAGTPAPVRISPSGPTAQPLRHHGFADRRERGLADSPSPGVAACSSRAATLTASPVARRSRVPVTTSPVFTPIRPAIPSSGSAARISTAARHRAEGVVLVRCGDAEHRHHRIADELLHRAAVRLDDRLHPVEVAGKQPTQRLRVDRLAEGRRSGQVAEQHGDRLAEPPAKLPSLRAPRRSCCRSWPLQGCRGRSSRM